ncbi:MAG: DNA translocase FtsK 4TM domain-containing protein [Chitinophagaceae bacterium]|nr:DNA translocase FtsK 4TM domain-containing protein [Chitinophagaceae bacterium]
MANKLKSKAAPNPNVLNEDKEPEVTVAEVVKDERTYKILGTISIGFAIFLFISIVSYLFSWQEDQDIVFNAGFKIFSPDAPRVHNFFGALGAFTAHNLVFNGFGVVSIVLSTFFFVLGVNLFFQKPVFSLITNLKYVIVSLLVISTSFAFATGQSQLSWGGAVGNYLNRWMNASIGSLGTGLTLLLSYFIFIIWKFNPKFNLPEKKKNVEQDEEFQETEQESKLFIDDDLLNEKGSDTIIGNKLKSEAGLVSVILPDEEQISFNIDEKNEEEIDPEHVSRFEEVENLPKQKYVPPSSDLPLEIKDVEEEVEKSPKPKSKTVEMANYEPTLDLSNYKYPSIDLLETHGSEKIVHDPTELETNKNQIIATLKNYDIDIQRIAATVGPTVTLYEIVPAPGVRISRIKNLEDDIALSLAALGIRIIAPIPGKGTIGIEVPNLKKTVVSMKSLISSDKFQKNNFSLPIAIGKKIDNENFIVDLTTMPHLLMAGATGQGKSVGINTLLVSLLFKKHPSQLKLVLVDPKKVELSLYKVIEKHFLAKLPGEDDSIITDTKKVVYTLNALCIEMDNRYDLLKEAGCRNIREYNEKFIARKLNPQKGHQFLPFIVLVVDEFADLIMTAGKEIEMPIARLAQLARAVGIHLIIATQRPSVNIITGTIKANFPARIAFKVSSKIDSRTILDVGGAEQLIGKGDMLISYNGEITRLQCAFVDTPEVDKICEEIGKQQGYPEPFYLPEYVDEKDMDAKDFDVNDRDPLFEDAARLIVQNQVGSTSLIQRRMKLGYNRAGRLMDQLEQAGIVGPNLGSKAREVRFKTEIELNEYLSDS